ncbi:hypothetical protein TVAG_026350 [Trichomonas vaginalis G3]|uniref:KATNIP domain-containing protein n=1 Tax=Trichomonas vaginalis (strain ATCC PRA-98 / G3) TaxID=412133 RepID=A2DZ38_TRIV3|nr:hypothetical protein TVAGG3_0504820 [Trichomonas vaginalis G3]EAY14314.1 hypothetical protein TVAG_026350 [Trichomonas vaginalis G3]KAI5517341.1 hypothetical protein TVAGG3_0504820 [Trichomonas vaginalis G3]|eukprot:XP_001326537.1 hypothetical protein [Trichomonas vaginalis G3]
MSSVKLIIPEKAGFHPMRRISTSASGRNIMLQPKGMPVRRISESPTFSQLPHRNQSMQLIHPSQSMDLPEQKYEIDLHLLSNYGHPSQICLSKIEVLTKDRIPISNVTVVPEDLKYVNESISFLTSNSLLKSTMNEMWHADFVPNGSPVIFHILVSAFLPPEFIRVFNSKIGESMNTKEVSVYIAGKFIQTTSVPLDFGSTVSLKASDFQNITPIENFLVTPKVPTFLRLKDDFGNLPILKTSSISFKLYNSTSGKPRLGLNGLEFFDLNGKLLSSDLITNIEVFNGASISSPRYLFKDDKNTMNIDDMWIAGISESPIVLRVEYSEPRLISLIRIWNYNGYPDCNLYSTKNIKIYINDTIPVYFGRLKRGKGMTTGIEESVTDIWVSENYHLKHLPQVSSIYSEKK